MKKEELEKIAERIMETYTHCPIIEKMGHQMRCQKCREDWNIGNLGCDQFKDELVRSIFIPFSRDISKRNNYKCRGVNVSKVQNPFKKGFREIILNKHGVLSKFVYVDLNYKKSGKEYFRPTDAFINIINGFEDIEDTLRS